MNSSLLSAVAAYRRPSSGDPSWASVKLLLNCDGTNGSTTVTDASTSAHTTTCGGTMALSTTGAKFGTACLLTNGSTGNKLTVSGTQSDWAFGTGDFTVEFHFYPTTLPSAAGDYEALVGNFTGSAGWTIEWLDDDRLYFSGGGTSIFTAASPFTMNAWNYIGVKRASGTVTIQIGSTVAASGPNTSDFTTLADLVIGGRSYSSLEQAYGRFDNVRVTKGVARTLAEPVAAWPTS